MILIFTQCAPVFSEVQSARTVGKHNVEITPSLTVNSVNEDLGEFALIPGNIGVQAAYGLSDRTDLRFRYESIGSFGIGAFGAGALGGGGHVSIGAKYSLIENYIAAYLPLRYNYGRIYNGFELAPTMLFTLPIKNIVDFTFSPKYVMSISSPTSGLFATNFGLAISNDMTRWSVRTEYGMLYLPEGYHVGQFSIGMSFTLGNK